MGIGKKAKIIMNVERAANDLRKGFPVFVGGLLVVSPETMLPELVESAGGLKLVVTANRMRYLTGGDGDAPFVIDIEDASKIAPLSGLSDDKVDVPDYAGAGEVEAGALKLAAIAELIPALVVLDGADDGFLSVSVDELNEYSEFVSHDLIEACRTEIALKGAVDSQIVAFRPKVGGKEHYAIIVGKPGDEPLVRVHSSCYTGDLLESLACDCHDQLHLAIDVMAKEGGGIILYMLQEGRGIGLINKLRAYALKGKGMDTVDANEALGFGDDERLFTPAAVMLEKLGVKKVRLLTNNPRKAKGLSECGIEVTECVRHVIEHNEHNEAYLKTKSQRLGHDI